MQYPDNYGAVMKPLDLSKLEGWIQKLMGERPEIRRWILLNEQTNRSEKVSSYLDWTEEQALAYEVSWELFSMLRGYTQDEIAQFRELSELHQKLCEEDEDLVWRLRFACEALYSTPELEAINADLVARQDAHLKSSRDKAPSE